MKKQKNGNFLELQFDFAEIERIELIKINSTIKAWYAKQTDKPDYVINGTLFTYKDYAPIGTVYIDGQLVRNQGNGYGIGLSDGKLYGGRPWDRKWQWYYTGYPPMVANSVKIDTSGWDVAAGNTKRVAVGLKGEKLYIISDYCSCKNLQTRYAGMDWLVNNDGGGSAYVMEHGTAINNPTENRKIANCIAIWLKRQEGTIKGKAKSKLSVYDKNGKLELRRYIGKGDIIEINPQITNNLLIEVKYPLIAGGTRKAYLKSLEGVQVP